MPRLSERRFAQDLAFRAALAVDNARAYNDAQTAGQVGGSTQRFVTIRGASHLFLLLAGSAMLALYVGLPAVLAALMFRGSLVLLMHNAGLRASALTVRAGGETVHVGLPAGEVMTLTWRE